MATITSSATLIIEQGVPITAAEQITFLGIGSAGTLSAKRRLVHPDSALAPITYWGNPKRTLNLDNDVLPHPITAPILTAGTTQVVRFERGIDDVIVTEIWPGDDARASMPTFFFRELYEYLNNPPEFSASAQTYIVWEPGDRTTKTYNVELLSLTVGGAGGGAAEDAFDVIDLRGQGGLYGGGTILNPLDDLNETATGLVDREVRLRMKIVSEVA
jgi:hypothetical protein